MALSSNNWYSVRKGPGVARLLMVVFGEFEEAGKPNLPFLTFTVQDDAGRLREVTIVLTGIGFEHPWCDYSRKVYKIEGRLWAVDRVILKEGAPPLFPVTVTHYVPDRQDKGHAALKISDSIGQDLEALFAA